MPTAGVLTCFVFAATAQVARAADQPVYAPAPAWVSPTKPAGGSEAGDDKPLRVLLRDNQVRFGPEVNEFYSETVVRAQTPEGLPGIGSISENWDPQTDVLTIHKLKILRGDQVIDVLAQGKTFTVLRREQNLEQSTLDGRLTATIQLEDLRVGDSVDFAVTIRHHDPSFKAQPEQFLGESGAIVVDHLRFRGVWPKTLPVRWRGSEDLPEPKVTHTGAEVELLLDMHAAKPPKPPKFAPTRYAELGQLQLSAYGSWPEVSTSLAPLFLNAALIAPSSPLRTEIQRIRADSNDLAVRAAEALRLVEQKVRYVFLGADLGGYKPVAADLTWERRFGDCKGKTVLLVAVLRELGLDATPVLVSTIHGDGLESRLPSLDFFNHAIVRLRLGGRVYWLDATRTGDRDLAHLQPPAFRWALPLTAQGSTLEPIEQPPLDIPIEAASLRLDASQGLTAPAPAHAEVILRGDAALTIDQVVRAATKEDVEKFSREFWTGEYSWITVKSLSTTYDPATGEAKLMMDGLAQLDWRDRDLGIGRGLQLTLANLGASTDLKREPDTRQDAPYAVNYPQFSTSEETLILPDHGQGYSVSGRDIDRTIGGVHYHRTTQIKDGEVISQTSVRALQREFPATEALTVQLGLTSLGSETVWARAPVAYGASKKELQGLSALDPTTTEAFFKRANEMLGKRETDKAIADYDEVLRREPGMAPALLGRGSAYVRKGELEKALADFDQALRLQPDLLPALYARAEARVTAHQVDGALADAAAALRLAPNSTDPYNSRARIYLRLGQPQRALDDYNASLKINPEGFVALQGRARAYAALGKPALAQADLYSIGESANVLNWRCYARAVVNLTLDEALTECDAAIGLAPKAPEILDSRGFVYFRKGELSKAIADFDAALTLDPKLSDSLYLRGLAKKRLGDSRGAVTDLAAAKGLDAQVARTFADYGVTD
jgi:tetratricopeptide (TPR) repeat protein